MTRAVYVALGEMQYGGGRFEVLGVRATKADADMLCAKHKDTHRQTPFDFYYVERHALE